MAKIIKEKEKDFVLISEKTKARIKGLIEKRLTTQTVALFAQEYESYDYDIRSEIIQYILFLLEKAQNELEFNTLKKPTEWDQKAFERRRLEFIEKQTNVKKIQDALKIKEPHNNELLAKNQQKLTQKSNEKPKEELLVKQEEPKITKEKKAQNSKQEKSIEIRLREAALREAKEAKELAAKKAKEEQQAKELAEKKAKEQQQAKEAAEKLKKEKELAAKQAKEAAEKKAKEQQQDKEVSSKVNKAKQVAIKKDVQPEVKIVRTQRDYEKEQAEKEKLWKELYGKSRVQTNEAKRPSTSSFVGSAKNTDKTPLIKEEALVNFKLYGHTYPIEELTDPKHKLYFFWTTIKNKYRSGNLSVWLKDQSKLKNWWIYKKRLKAQKHAFKTSSSTNTQPQKKEVVVNKNNLEKENTQKTSD